MRGSAFGSAKNGQCNSYNSKVGSIQYNVKGLPQRATGPGKRIVFGVGRSLAWPVGLGDVAQREATVGPGRVLVAHRVDRDVCFFEM